MEINFIDITGDTPKQTTLTMPNLPAWTMAREIGYTPKTTFWQDFSIADLYGAPYSILDRFNRAFMAWRNNVEYIAEMSLVLNHKGCWYYNATRVNDRNEKDENDPLYQIAQLYFHLFRRLDDWARENLTGDNAEYYYKVTD